MLRARLRAEEALERRREVAGRQPVQVESGQHLGDLRRPAAPRRDDLGLELGLLACLLVPVSSSTRRSFTRGARISTALATVWILRARAWPLRVTSAWPLSSRSPASSARYASTSASRAAASIVRAPSRQISSRIDSPSARAVSSFTTLSIGVPSSPAFHRRLLVLNFNEDGTPRLGASGRSTTSGHTSETQRRGARLDRVRRLCVNSVGAGSSEKL